MKWRLSALFIVLVLLAPVAVLYSGTAKLEGNTQLKGLNKAVVVDRDNRGVPRIKADNNLDLARALGYLHAQERFFQMDLLRRSAAGELAELVGDKALPYDRNIRRHRFRARAEAALATMNAEDSAILQAYTQGVNAGLKALHSRPWEYWLLRQQPRPWQPADSLLVIDAMYLDLQGDIGQREWSLAALAQRLSPAQQQFWFPFGGSLDAALDDTFPTPQQPPAQPLPNLDTASQPAPPLNPGSNAWAVAGRFTQDGAAMLASDMHLTLRVPNIWYRAAARIKEHFWVGLTLPGAPALVVGSNGHIAWGFTNSYGDFSDLAVITPVGKDRYQTPQGPQPYQIHKEVIRSASGHSETLTIKDTRWGPIMGTLPDGRPYAQLWEAHRPDAVNMRLRKLVDCPDVNCALTLAPTLGIPTQNMVVVDTRGNIAWTLAGPIPERLGYEGLAPVDLSNGEHVWHDRLPASAYPRRINPTGGRIWSANQRMLGGAELDRIGDGGYALGERAGRIRDVLRSKDRWQEKGFFALQMDNRVPLYDFWQQQLLQALKGLPPSPEMVKATRLVANWDGQADAASQGFWLIEQYRQQLLSHLFAPFYALQKTLPGFRVHGISSQWEYPLRTLVTSQPAAYLPTGFESWSALLQETAARLVADTARADWPSWGQQHLSRIRHPLSAALPDWLGKLIDAPVVPQSGNAFAVHVTGTTFGASERLVVTPGQEDRGILVMPGGQSDNPLSPYYLDGQSDWQQGKPEPLMPQESRWQLTLTP